MLPVYSVTYLPGCSSVSPSHPSQEEIERIVVHLQRRDGRRSAVGMDALREDIDMKLGFAQLRPAQRDLALLRTDILPRDNDDMVTTALRDPDNTVSTSQSISKLAERPRIRCTHLRCRLQIPTNSSRIHPISALISRIALIAPLRTTATSKYRAIRFTPANRTGWSTQMSVSRGRLTASQYATSSSSAGVTEAARPRRTRGCGNFGRLASR